MKELYLLIVDQLKALSIKWIDFDSGQLDQTKPALKYPCTIIKISNIPSDIDESGSQEKKWTVQLRTAFDATGIRTNAEAPEEVIERSLAYTDTVNAIYTMFQAAELGDFTAFECIQEQQEDRVDGLVVFKHVFITQQMVFK